VKRAATATDSLEEGKEARIRERKEEVNM